MVGLKERHLAAAVEGLCFAKRQPHWKVHEYGDAQVLVAGAAEALGYFA